MNWIIEFSKVLVWFSRCGNCS